MSQLWRYEKEPAGMGEYCYGIYRAGLRFCNTDQEAYAMIMVNGLNREEDLERSSGQEVLDVLEFCLYAIQFNKKTQEEIQYGS